MQVMDSMNSIQKTKIDFSYPGSCHNNLPPLASLLEIGGLLGYGKLGVLNEVTSVVEAQRRR